MKKLFILSVALSSLSSGFGQEIREYGSDDPVVRTFSAHLEHVLRIAGSTRMPDFVQRLMMARYSARSIGNDFELQSSTIGKAEFKLNMTRPTLIEITPPNYANSITTRLNIVSLSDKAEEVARLFDNERWFLVLASTRQDPVQHLVSFEFKRRLRIAPNVGPLSSIAGVSLDDRTGELRKMWLPPSSGNLNIDPARVTTTYSNAQLRSTAIGLFLALRPFDNVIEGISGLTYSVPSRSNGEDHGFYRGMGWLTNEHLQLAATNTGTLTYEIRLLNANNRKQIVFVRLDARTNSPMSYLFLDTGGLGMGTTKQATSKLKAFVNSCQLRDTDGIAIPLKFVDQQVKTGETIACIVEIDTNRRVLAEIDVQTGYGRFKEETTEICFKADPKLLKNLVKPLLSFVKK